MKEDVTYNSRISSLFYCTDISPLGLGLRGLESVVPGSVDGRKGDMGGKDSSGTYTSKSVKCHFGLTKFQWIPCNCEAVTKSQLG